MVGTLALVFGFLRARRESLSQVGLGWRKESFRLLAAGFLSGIFLAGTITLVQLGLGARFWHVQETDWGHWVGFFLKGLGAGFLIGTLEEFFFRGFLFLTLTELWTRKAGLIVTNLIYALVHFFPKGGPLLGPEPTAADSFRILGAVVLTWFRPEILPALFGLFLFGLLLSFVFLRTGSLFPAIGVHAGAVFTLKLNRRFLPELSQKMGMLSGSKNLYDGIAGLLILALALLWLGKGRGQRSPILFRCWNFPLVLMLFLLLPPLPARAAERPPREIIFSFLQGLPYAQAVRQGEGQSFTGEWKGDRFHFEGLPALMAIYTTEVVAVEGKTRAAIWFQPWRDLDTTLVFSSVPVGKRLRIFFALGDSDFSHGRRATPVYFEAWIGKKKLFDAQVNTRDWKEKSFDLTLPYFLQRKSRFSFKIQASEKQQTSFIFYGYIE